MPVDVKNHSALWILKQSSTYLKTIAVSLFYPPLQKPFLLDGTFKPPEHSRSAV